MKNTTVLILLLVLSGCRNRTELSSTDRHAILNESFQSAMDKTSIPLKPEDILYLDSILNTEVLVEYYKTSKDSTLDRDFDSHAFKYWDNLENLNLIDSSSFSLEITDEIKLTTRITSIEHSLNKHLVFLQMYPDDGSSWSCGVCPGYIFILKYRRHESHFILEGTTGRVPYSFKYGRGISSSEVVHRDSNSYLLVTTDAGGVGQGREGVTIYSMEPFGNILLSKIFIDGYRGVYFLPQDYSKIEWVLHAFATDTNKVKPREIHVYADLKLDYTLNPTLDTLSIERNGSIDYHISFRDLKNGKRSMDDTINSIHYHYSIPIIK